MTKAALAYSTTHADHPRNIINVTTNGTYALSNGDTAQLASSLSNVVFTVPDAAVATINMETGDNVTIDGAGSTLTANTEYVTVNEITSGGGTITANSGLLNLSIAGGSGPFDKIVVGSVNNGSGIYVGGGYHDISLQASGQAVLDTVSVGSESAICSDDNITAASAGNTIFLGELSSSSLTLTSTSDHVDIFFDPNVQIYDFTGASGTDFDMSGGLGLTGTLTSSYNSATHVLAATVNQGGSFNSVLDFNGVTSAQATTILGEFHNS